MIRLGQLSFTILIVVMSANAMLEADFTVIELGVPVKLKTECYHQTKYAIRQADLKPNKQYQVSVYSLGYFSGYHVQHNWINGSEKYYTKDNPRFRPLDMHRLNFNTNETGHIVDIPTEAIFVDNGKILYTFVVFAFRNSRALSKEAFEEPVDLYIQVATQPDSVILSYVVSWALVGCIMIWGLKIAKQKSSFVRRLLSVSAEYKSDD